MKTEQVNVQFDQKQIRMIDKIRRDFSITSRAQVLRTALNHYAAHMAATRKDLESFEGKRP